MDESGAVDPNVAVMAKVSTRIEVLRPGGSYELVYKLLAQFILSAGRVSVDVTQRREEVLVWYFICCVIRTYHDKCIHFVECLVHYSGRDKPSDLVMWHQLGKT